MNKPLAYSAGAVIGGGIGYFVGAVIVEIIYIKQHKDELDDPYGGVTEDEQTEKQLDPKEPVIFMGHNKNVKTAGRVRNYTEHFKSQGKPELAALVAKYNMGEVEISEPSTGVEPDVQFEDELADDDQDTPGPIQIISMDEYAGLDGYQTVTLRFYEDDVVTDEHDNPIDHPEDILGDEALVSFGELSGDEDIVYVRNDTKRAAYEVVRTNTEYSATPVRRNRRPNKEEKHAEEDNT